MGFVNIQNDPGVYNVTVLLEHHCGLLAEAVDVVKCPGLDCTDRRGLDSGSSDFKSEILRLAFGEFFFKNLVTRPGFL